MHSVQTGGDGGGGGSDSEDELVTSTPDNKNIRSILISLLVIFFVCSLILLSIQIVRPVDEGPRVKGRKLTLKDITSRKFALSPPFNGSWISEEELVLRDGEGSVVIFNARTLSSTLLIPNRIFGEVEAVKYSLSADRAFILLAHSITHVWEYSYLAKYYVYDIEKRFKSVLSPLDEKIVGKTGADVELQYAEWGTTSNQILMVYRNDIYYKESVSVSPAVQLTASGHPGLVFNGIPDWLYGVEILRSNKAVWFSPGGNSLIYASFNDTEVGEVFVPLLPNSNTSPYPRLRKFRYPKAGTRNPEVALYVVRLDPSNDTVAASIPFPPEIDAIDHYLTSVQWVTNQTLSLIWMNRVQNVATFGLCEAARNSTAWECNIVYKLKPPDLGWMDFPPTPIYSKDLTSCLLRIPWRDGEAGYFHHIIWLEVKSGKEVPLTAGPFEVTQISSWDEDNYFIYFTGVLQGKPSERHLFRIQDNTSNSTEILSPTCLTCLEVSEKEANLEESGFTFPAQDPNPTPCLYNRALFSPRSQWYVKECLGPGVPTATLHQAPSGTLLQVLNANEGFKTQVAKLGLPLLKTFKVQVSGGYRAPTRLYLPPGFREGEDFKFPLLLHLSGRPGSQIVSEKWRMSWASYMASQRNFVVVEVDGRGSGFQGENVRQAVHGALGGREVSDQLEVLRYLKDNLSFIDERNMAVWGSGYGGFLTLLALARDGARMLRCGIAVSPITKWEYYDTVFTERYLGLLNETDSFEGYEGADVVRRVRRYRGRKLMLIHATGDEKVHYQHTLHLTRALIREGLPFTQQIYPDEGHGYPRFADHLYKTMERYLDENLDRAEWEDWDKANFLGAAT